MKLRTILLILASLSFMTVSIGGYLYYSTLKASLLKEAERQVSLQALSVRNRLSSFLSENLKTVRAMAGMKELQQALVKPDKNNLEEAYLILENVCDAFELDVCYLMDANGETIVSSNRYESDSFVGKNYGFRPYFKKAVQGIVGVYIALGVTSKKRGAYYSHPIYTENRENPAGVLAIKFSMEVLEEELIETNGGIWLLTDPHGIIFASNQSDWHYHLLKKLSSEEISEIVATRQFGNRPYPWSGLKITDENRAVDQLGDTYLLRKTEIDIQPGWNLYYLINLSSALGILSEPLVDNIGAVILFFCILIGLSVSLLYKKARLNIEQSKKIEATLRRQNEYLAALHETTLGLIGRLDLKELIEAIIARAGALSNTENGFLFLHDSKRDELEIRVASGAFSKDIGYRIRTGEGFVGKIWKTGTPSLIENYPAWTGRIRDPRFENIHSMMGIPLKIESHITGVLALAHIEPDKVFGEDELDILSRFADLASVALDNARLYRELQKANEELERLAVIDGLTQIANRRLFDEYLNREWKRMARERRPLSLILCDVDYFKCYNDTYGHLSGDDCLRAIAQAIQKNTKRPADLAARYGGEEFAVIMGNTAAEGAVKIAEDIRRDVRHLRIAHDSSPVDRYVTISLGVSTIIPHSECSPETFIRMADKALYKAKAHGRDRVDSEAV